MGKIYFDPNPDGFHKNGKRKEKPISKTTEPLDPVAQYLKLIWGLIIIVFLVQHFKSGKEFRDYQY